MKRMELILFIRKDSKTSQMLQHLCLSLYLTGFLKEINTEYSLGGLMLELKLQHFGQLMQRVNSLEKTLMLRKIVGRR